jgi:hypothetical protein
MYCCSGSGSSSNFIEFTISILNNKFLGEIIEPVKKYVLSGYKMG